MGPHPTWLVSLQEGGNRRTGTMPCDCRGRDCNAAAASPGTPGTTRSWQRQEASSLKASGGAQPCQCFDFRLPASRTVREYTSVILCVCVCVCVFFHFGCTGSSLHAGLYPVAYGSSLTRVWTCVLCIGRETLNHWTTREVPNFCSFRPPSLWYFVMAALGNEDTFIPPTQKP